MASLLITLACIAGVVAVLITMIRYENARPYLAVVAFGLMLFSGAYSGFTMWDYYNTHSKVIGQLEEHDPYEEFNFYEYELKNFALLQDAETQEFYYQTSYATSIEFNGTESSYTLLVNDKPCDVTKSNYGKLYGTTTIHFDDVDGAEITAIELDINFTFYASSIVLEIQTNATQDNAGMLEEYFKINKFNLRIIEEIKLGEPILKGSTS